MKYLDLVEIYKKLEATTKRLEKTHHIAELLKKTSLDDMHQIVLLIQGRLYPPWDDREIGVASRMVLKSINVATGIRVGEIEREWKKTGDLGKTAENLTHRKKQRTLFKADLTVKKVFNNLRKLSELEGPGSVDSKISLIAELLTSARPMEARYIVRTILEELRVGVAAGTLRDAVVWSFFGKELEISFDEKKQVVRVPDRNREKYNKYLDAVQKAADVSNDFSLVAEKLKKHGLKGLEQISLVVGKPIKVMLYQKAKDLQDAFDTVGKPAALEYKFDGFRMMLHRKGDKITLFTRRLDNVTKQFPDVVDVIKDGVKAKEFILDSEVIGIDPKTRKWLPFQNISQRIKRKYDIHDICKKIPVMVNVFDIMELNGENIIQKPFKKRRELMEKIVKKVPNKLQLAPQVVTASLKDAEKFYKESLTKGNEGVMVKALDAVYKPGSRVGYGVKVKPVMETLDVVIVGADWGEGKRAQWLSSFTIACRDEKTDQLLEIGKVGTGIKEKTGEGVSFKQLTEMLKPSVVSEKGRSVRVKPKIVIEVTYEEIQKSPTYGSGFALRFPRVLRLRAERSKSDASTISEVRRLYEMQRGRK